MEILFLLIPLAVLVAVVIAAFFFWSVKSGQFDDLEGPAHAILMDNDQPQAGTQPIDKDTGSTPGDASKSHG